MKNLSLFWRYRHAFAPLTVLAALPGLYTLPAYHNWHWLAMVPAVIITVIFLYRPTCTDRVIFLKVFVDMTLIGLNFAVGRVPLELAQVTLYVSSIIYFALNLIFFESMALQGALMLLLLVPVVRGVVEAAQGRTEHLLLITLLSILLASATYVFLIIRRRQVRSRNLSVQDLEMRFQVADSTLRIVQLRERLLIHDCKNLLSQLTRVEIAEKQGKAHPEVTALVLETRRALVGKLDALRDLEAVSFRPHEVITRLVALTPPGAGGYAVHIPHDLVLRMETHLFESIIYNLCRNAWEAWVGHPNHYGGFRFSIRWNGSAFVLEDNAGGFDPLLVAPGYTTKEKGQGQFLHTLLKHQAELGVGFTLVRGTFGMVATVTPPTPEGVPPL